MRRENVFSLQAGGRIVGSDRERGTDRIGVRSSNVVGMFCAVADERSAILHARFARSQMRQQRCESADRCNLKRGADHWFHTRVDGLDELATGGC